MTTPKTLASLVAITLISAAAGGCLLRDELHTWYLEPDGAVSWQVIEKDVRSDAGATTDRANEDSPYINAVRQEDHPVAHGLARLAPLSVRTEVLRATPPFTVVTEARFGNIGVLGERLLAISHVSGTSALERTPTGFTWTFTIRDQAPDGKADEVILSSQPPDDDGVSELLNEIENLHVVLLRGAFTATRGFELSIDKRVATLKSDDRGIGEAVGPETHVMSLSWKAAD